MQISRAVAVAVALLFTNASFAAAFTVTNTNDDGAGSLRVALASTDTTTCPAPGSCQIVFNIAGSPGSDGAFTIHPLNTLPTAYNTIIDGATQTAFSGDTNTSGPEVVIAGSMCPATCTGMTLADGSELRHVVVNGFFASTGRGIVAHGETAGVTIAANYIGTDAKGLNAASNDYGIETRGRFVTITGNVISGNSFGIFMMRTLSWSQDDNTITGNLIGTSANGFDPLPNNIGVRIAQGSIRPRNNQVGGLGGGDANVIAFNTTWGVELQSMGCFNLVRGNSIHSNGDAGIYRADSACALCTPEAGCPVFAKAPQLLNATYNSGTNKTTVSGDYYDVATTAVTLDWYTNSVPDPSGFGEGESYLATTNVMTDANGEWSAELTGDQRTTNLTATTTESPFSNVLGGTGDLRVTNVEQHADPVAPGERLHWTVTVENRTSDAAPGVRVDDALTGSLSNVQVTAGAEWSCSGTSHIVCTLAQPLAGNASASFVVEATPNQADTTYHSDASVSSLQADMHPSDNAANELTYVRAYASDLLVEQMTAPPVAPAGGQIEYEIRVTNEGPDAASTSASITFSPQVAVEEIRAAGGIANCTGTFAVTCDLGTLAVHDARVLLLTVRAPATATTVTGAIHITSPNTDAHAADNTAQAETQIVQTGRRRSSRH